MFYTDRLLLLLHFAAGLISCQSITNDDNVCATSSCYPSTGDLLIGREDTLRASSICGLKRPEQYCVISYLKERDNCFYCDSRRSVSSDFSHLPKYMVSLFKSNEVKDTWWQSENGKENVYLQLDFEAQFHVTHIVMKFHSFRPAAMLIERSYDYGKNWEVGRYYAKNCQLSFPGVPTSVSANSSKTYCTKEYSGIEPSSGGEVVYNALNSRIPESKAWTPEVQNLLRTTNIRINFTKLNTLGDDIIDNSADTDKKYFYAIKWITIRGSCSCYGHAQRCLPLPGDNDVVGMVHGRCNCTHNTAGLNCERCKSGYDDRPWAPAFPGQPNECKKCECNNHADQCRFDRAVWEQSGQTSGGVCLDCQHDTTGKNCQKCRPLFYQDPSKSIRDPDVCRPCDCDPDGSVNRGECQKKDNRELNLRAGQCICKVNVDGRRCDRCKTGFFNLDGNDPDGCQSCGCNSFGTYGNNCDTNTGQCFCKRNVVGKTCDSCRESYWGLQTEAGCQPCECDVGGAINNLCDAITGQCKCRAGITGRKCDRVIPGYFFSLSDNLKYEAEEGTGIGITSTYLLERPDGTRVTWTDVGTMKINSESAVEFSIGDLPMTGDYKILLRFHPRTESFWQDARVSISRADGRVQNGECGDSLSSNGENTLVTRINQNLRYKVMEQVVCLEKNTDYFVRVHFGRYVGNVDSVYLDSVVLIPSTSSISIFQGNSGQTRLRTYESYRCESADYPVENPRRPVHSVCEKLQFSSSAIIYNGALECQCHEVGSIKNESSGVFICQPAAGQCDCKPNVIGRQCDKCAPGSYNFGANGCSPCDCHPIGSYDNFCDLKSGQCACNDLGIGRQCNECPPKEWGFPKCRPCECNGHAETCDAKTGVCINCQHNTAGDHCELCKDGYFGDALKGTTTDCQKCQCPGGSSENQFSPTCKVDTSTNPPSFICNKCPPGYKGKQCEECEEGYYGNPLVPGGECKICDCHGNVDFANGGRCDKRTGQCEGCLYNTDGFFCDQCKTGFYGNAKNQTCQPCNCYDLGTNKSSGACDTMTGQCPCKSNIVGRSCNSCAPGYWNLNSDSGCESCDCCAQGTTDVQCDAVTGKCDCRRDYGGDKCCSCEKGFWGKPPTQCKPCDCNPSGSMNSQCDGDTGICECRPGIAGKKCNKCEEDTTQEFPECGTCHPCYYSWLKIINDLDVIFAKIDKSGTSGPGVTVDYTKELDELDKIQERIRAFLKNRTTTPEHVKQVRERLLKANDKLAEILRISKETSRKLSTTDANTQMAETEIEKLRNVLKNMQNDFTEFEKKLNDIKGQVPTKSLNVSRASLEKSTKAIKIADGIMGILEDSEEERLKLEEKIPPYDKKKKAFRSKVDEILLEFESLDGLVKEVNKVVCGDHETGCGGCNASGCDQCGGEDCMGATTVAKKALKLAKKSFDILLELETKANASLDDVNEAETLVKESKKEAEIALELAKKLRGKSLNVTGDISGFIEEVYKVLNRTGPDPDEIRRIAEFVLNRKLNISEDEIKDLGDKIKKAVRKLTGLDAILEETERDLANLDDLKDRAKKANSSAVKVGGIAEEVKEKLDKIDKVQKKSKKSIKKAARTIKNVEYILVEIEKDLGDRSNKSEESVRITKSLTKRSGPLKDKFEELDKNLNDAEIDSNEALDTSSKSVNDGKNVRDDYQKVNERYQQKLNELERFRERAEKVRSGANDIQISLTTKLDSLKGFIKRRVELDNLLDKLRELEKRSKKELCKVVNTAEFLLTCVTEGDIRKDASSTCP